MDQNNYEDQEPTDTPSTVPTTFQVSCDQTLYPECPHNPMGIQCNQYPNLNHNLALSQFLVHHNCEDLDLTDTPIAVPTALKAPSYSTYNPKCAHNPMETQCNQSQYPTLMKHNCTHNPSVSQVGQNNHSNPVAFPYPPDPGEHVLERSVVSTALLKMDKLDLSSLAPQNRGNSILFKVQKSFWSCTHVNSCQNNILYINLHIILNILSKATSNIQESRKSIKFLKR